MSREFVATACPHDCPSTCALEVERLSPGRIGAVRGARENDYTSGVICAKVARYAERVHHPGRLAQPLQRTGKKGAGEFRPIGWDDALDLIADSFVRAEEKHGPEAVWPYYYAGTMGLVQRDGINRLRHVMKYSGQDETICSRLSSDGWWAGVGTYVGSDPREMAKADLIVVWGCNPASTQVNVMTHIAKARKTRNAALVVVDPYETRTAKVANHHMALRPGTDGALACGIMHVLFAEDFADRDYLARHTDCPGEFEAHLASRDPAWASAITGIPAAEIVALARMIGRIKRTYIRLGYGFTRSRNGAANMHAATCIAAVTGAWQYEGGGAMHTNKSVFGVDATLIEGLDARDRSVRLLDMSRIGPVLTGNASDLGDGPPVTAIVMQNVNPASVAPESAKVREGLMRDDLFLAVHEQFMTDTARYADIVLPATTFLEHDDIYVGGGHSYLLMGARVIEPYAETRSNHDVIRALAKRLGAEHPGFDMTAWEMIDATLKRSGHPDAATLKAMRWKDCMPEFESAHHLNGFGWPDGRFRFKPDWTRMGPRGAEMPALPDHMAVTEAPDAEHPFRLVTAPAHNYLNSSFTETPTSIAKEARPSALFHPGDARDLGFEDGDRIRIGNRRGSILLHARLAGANGKVPDSGTTLGQQRGTVIVESIWPNTAFEEGLGINTLTSADPGYPNGGAVFHDTAIWARPAN